MRKKLTLILAAMGTGFLSLFLFVGIPFAQKHPDRAGKEPEATALPEETKEPEEYGEARREGQEKYSGKEGEKDRISASEASVRPSTKEPTPTPILTPKPIFRGYKHIPGWKQELVELAESYAGKIAYQWGGKPTDADILGKTEPVSLDCSGFIQFVCSRIQKKREEHTGSTIAIAGLKQVKEPHPGDIGLRYGTGTLYYDADGNTYPEPEPAEAANEKALETAEEAYEKAEKKIQTFRRRIGAYRIAIGRHHEKIEELREKQEEKRTEARKERILLRREMIDDYHSGILLLKEKIKEWKEKKKEAEKEIKRYDTEVIRKIDHTGIYCGKDKKGRSVWCHCSSAGGGVVVEATEKFKFYYRLEGEK